MRGKTELKACKTTVLRQTAPGIKKAGPLSRLLQRTTWRTRENKQKKWQRPVGLKSFSFFREQQETQGFAPVTFKYFTILWANYVHNGKWDW